MSDNDDYLRLRRMTGETQDKINYTDADLDILILASAGNLNVAAASIWREKAAGYADLVDISEAGSSRKNSDLYNRAQAQADYFSKASTAGVALVEGFSTTRRIVRG